jgi:hypothetical protein
MFSVCLYNEITAFHVNNESNSLGNKVGKWRYIGTVDYWHNKWKN